MLLYSTPGLFLGIAHFLLFSHMLPLIFQSLGTSTWNMAQVQDTGNTDTGSTENKMEEKGVYNRIRADSLSLHLSHTGFNVLMRHRHKPPVSHLQGLQRSKTTPSLRSAFIHSEGGHCEVGTFRNFHTDIGRTEKSMEEKGAYTFIQTDTLSLIFLAEVSRFLMRSCRAGVVFLFFTV